MKLVDALTHLRNTYAGRRIVYLAPDAGRTLGLRSLVADLVTVCFDSMGIEGDENNPILIVPENDSDLAQGSASLLDNPDVPGFLRARGVTDIVAFKVNARMVQRATQLGLRVLAGPPAVAQRFENKIHFSSMLSELGICAPATQRFPLGLSHFDPSHTHLRSPWIVQAARGHSGQSSWIVTDAKQWQTMRDSFGMLPGRVAEFVPGPTWTANGAVLDVDRIAVGPGFRQVTGIQTLTPFPLGACGNCWGMPSDLENKVRDVAKLVGRALAAANYRGAFGIDVVVPDAGPPLVIETNPRVTSGQAMESLLLQAAGSVSPLFWHLMAFGGDPAGDVMLDPSAVIRGSQLIFYNPEPEDGVLTTAPVSGTYEVTPAGLKWASSEVNPAKLADSCVVILARTKGRRVPKGSEILRVQTRDVWLDDQGRLTDHAEQTVSMIRRRWSVSV
ncbi:MAG: ATP-grasp domain-containing protein [Myxococcales bacterium]|nr:ATP-grasp domain-containing protein [Myxococcales bacterium]